MSEIQHLSLTRIQLKDHSGVPLGYSYRTQQLKYKVLEGDEEGQILSVRVTRPEDCRCVREFFDPVQ